MEGPWWWHVNVVVTFETKHSKSRTVCGPSQFGHGKGRRSRQVVFFIETCCQILLPFRTAEGGTMYFSMRKNTVHTRADGLACMLDWTGLARVVGLDLGLKLGLEL